MLLEKQGVNAIHQVLPSTLDRSTRYYPALVFCMIDVMSNMDLSAKMRCFSRGAARKSIFDKVLGTAPVGYCK